MISYFFSNDNNSQLLNIEAIFENIASNTFEIQLPYWRPGRYQRQNFSKNIVKISAFDSNNKQLKIKKLAWNQWQVDTTNTKTLILKYTYFANEIDAGNSLIKGDFWKINPINLILFNVNQINDPSEIIILNPSKRKLAIGTNHKTENNTYKISFSDYYELFDSPFFLGKNISKYTYKVNKKTFNIWIEGFINFDTLKMIADFKKFTKEQYDIFGEFPFEKYNFYIHILPESYYHGVEHANSTLIILGPNSQNPAELYHDLLGIASHELFHAWNICKIRPAELLPYDFTQECYFETCFVAEGFTTYYGDLILNRSGIFDSLTYLKELEACYKRHFEISDNASQSLLESSFDLWVDGYEKGIPNRKVSVYHKGAIAAQALDIIIRTKFNNIKSLDTVMKVLWNTYGNMQSGYTYDSVKQICESVYEDSLDFYFKLYIEGTESIFEDFKNLVEKIDINLHRNHQNSITVF